MEKVLKVPYASQRDNIFNPSGSCNVTSIAMCLRYLGVVGDGSYTQLEDQLYKACLDMGLSRHDPNDLARLVNTKYGSIGIQDIFNPYCTFKDIKDAIDADKPCVVHGYFTRSGHIVVIKGYNDKGFIVNDPWGEYYPDGYDTSVSGEGLLYSYNLIARVCSPETESNPRSIWLHRISKK